MQPLRRALVAGLLSLAPAPTLAVPPPLEAGPLPCLPPRLCSTGLTVPTDSMARSLGPGRAFLYSVVVPGSGQWLLGQGRWPPYTALELWVWVQFLDARREGTQLRNRYRDLAWLVARRVSVGSRRDGDFEYYEALSSFRASGALDADPVRPGIQPEPDERTYNGSAWALAKAIFFPAGEGPPPEDSPEYQRALAHYRQRAYSSEFAWDWGENGLEQEAYMRLIRSSDEVLRRATIMIGVLLGNHLVSAVDALISARIQARLPLPPVGVEALYDPRSAHGGWLLVFRVRP